MKNKLHRFESFEPRQLDNRKDSPTYKKLEVERLAKEEMRRIKAEEMKMKYNVKFDGDKPVLALELANKIGGRVERDGEHTWKIECDELHNPYAEFAIWFSLEPEEDVIGFQIIDVEGEYIYRGLDVEAAYVSMEI